MEVPRDAKGRLLPGSKLWLARTKHGRDRIFASPELLWEACCEYFQWVEDNPIYEAKPMICNGEIEMVMIPKMRAMTLDGLRFFLRIDKATWLAWRGDAYFSTIVDVVDDTIRNQKFTGAAAGQLNANIIARDLGLTDKTDHTSSDGSMTPKRDMAPDEIEQEMRRRGIPIPRVD